MSEALPFPVTRNDTVNFEAQRAKAFAAGCKFEVEIGDSNASEFAWFETEKEAIVGHTLLLREWEDYAESEGLEDDIEHNAVRLLGTDDDGDHDSCLDEIVYEDSNAR